MSLPFKIFLSLALVVVDGVAAWMLWDAGHTLWLSLSGASADSALPLGLAVGFLILGLSLVPLVTWLVWAIWWYGRSSTQAERRAGKVPHWLKR